MLLLLLLLLLLRAQLTVTNSTDLISKQGQGSHSLMIQCMTDEYWTGRHCCKDCPAGEYVHEPCRSPHTQGKCVQCDRGTFTAFPNGLDSCFPCNTCSQDKEIVAECNSTSNWICRCKTGHFYQLPDSYEFCRRCSTCPKGHVVLHKCNSTADTVCCVPDPEHTKLSLIVVGCLIVVLVIIALLCYAVCHCRRNGNGDRRVSTVSGVLVSHRGTRRRPRHGSHRGSGPSVGPEGAVPAPGAGGGLSISHGCPVAKREPRALSLRSVGLWRVPFTWGTGDAKRAWGALTEASQPAVRAQLRPEPAPLGPSVFSPNPLCVGSAGPCPPRGHLCKSPTQSVFLVFSCLKAQCT
ncbi:uncharacterized protein RBU33_002383 isoform 1-T2 [Hipposideros larvatus]